MAIRGQPASAQSKTDPALVFPPTKLPRGVEFDALEGALCPDPSKKCDDQELNLCFFPFGLGFGRFRSPDFIHAHPEFTPFDFNSWSALYSYPDTEGKYRARCMIHFEGSPRVGISEEDAEPISDPDGDLKPCQARGKKIQAEDEYAILALPKSAGPKQCTNHIYRYAKQATAVR